MRATLTKSVVPRILAIPLALGLAAPFSLTPAYAEEAPGDSGTYTVEINLDCQENLVFSRYDLNILVDNELVANIDHGKRSTVRVDLPAGEHVLTVENEDDNSVDGHEPFTVANDTSLDYEVSCTKDQVEIERAKPKSDVTQAAKSSSLDSALASLESARHDASAQSKPAPVAPAEPTPRDYAERAVLVAMTNRNATDVFTDDGSAYDPLKFHRYDDTTGYHMVVKTKGTWSETGADAWHVDNLLLEAPQTGLAVQVSADVTFDGTNYVVSNVTGYAGNLDKIQAGDTATLEPLEENPSEFTSYLTVPAELVAGSRPDPTDAKASDATAGPETQGEASPAPSDQGSTGEDERISPELACSALELALSTSGFDEHVATHSDEGFIVGVTKNGMGSTVQATKALKETGLGTDSLTAIDEAWSSAKSSMETLSGSLTDLAHSLGYPDETVTLVLYDDEAKDGSYLLAVRDGAVVFDCMAS